MAAHVPPTPSSPSLLDEISKSRWDEKLEYTPLPSPLVWDTEASCPDEVVPYGSPGGWGYMDHHLPWTPEEDWAESEPPALKEAENLPSTPTAFGRDVGNLPHAVSVPRTLDSQASEVDDDDFFDSGEELEDLVVYYGDDDAENSDVETEGDDAGEDDDYDEEDGEEGDDEDEDEEEDEEDEDKNAFVENDGVASTPVSQEPDTAQDDDAEEVVAQKEQEARVIRRSVSPWIHTADPCLHTTDSGCPAQHYAAAAAAADAVPVLRSKDEKGPWTKPQLTKFVLERAVVDPDAILECIVPKEDGQPCGMQFPRKEIREARIHFRKVHVLKEAETGCHVPSNKKANKKANKKKKKTKKQATEEEQEAEPEYACPWPECKDTIKKLRDTARHVDIHWGMMYQCPLCPCPAMSRSDSCLRHVRKCQETQAQQSDFHTSTHAGDDTIVQPAAGPSTQRKRPARAPTQQNKPQPRSRAQPKQPEAGTSRGRKRSRRCVEEEDEEISQEGDSESDDDNGDGSDWVPTKSDRKGKGKAPERKRKKR